MRTDLLISLELEFYQNYPGGFDNPELQKIIKKHRIPKMCEMVDEYFAEDKFGISNVIVENMVKVISRSSLISVFEKPKLKDFVANMAPSMKDMLSAGLYERLHGNHEMGFQMMLDVLTEGKLAKWSLISVIPYYYKPTEEAFMKPTTVKGIIKTFEFEDLQYKPRPSYDFYVSFKEQLTELMQHVDSSLAPNYGAFTGFLMMSLPKDR